MDFSDSEVKLINTQNLSTLLSIRDKHPSGVKHVSYHPSGVLLATSGADGVLRFFSISQSESSSIVLTKSLDGIIPKVEGSNAYSSSKLLWHPSGNVFAVPTITNSISIYERSGWREAIVFSIDREAIKSAKRRTDETGSGGSLQTNDESQDINDPNFDSKTDTGEGSEKISFSISDLAWSPNGGYLAACTADGYVIVWDVNKRQVVHATKVPYKASALAWNPTDNELSFTTSGGSINTLSNVIKLTEGVLPPHGPRISINLSNKEDSIDNLRKQSNLTENTHTHSDIHNRDQAEKDFSDPKNGSTSEKQNNRNGLNDLQMEGGLDDISVAPSGMDDEDEDDWIEDDDGNYAKERAKERYELERSKREHGAISGDEFLDNEDNGNKGDTNGYRHASKRVAVEQSSLHSISRYLSKKIYKPFQQGSTQWNMDRRYLTMNLIGYIWSIREDIHNTITVSFFDRGHHREYHFKDAKGYDLACLTKNACLFGYSGSEINDKQSTNTDKSFFEKEDSSTAPKVFYRPHTGRNDGWEYKFVKKIYGTVLNVALSKTRAQVYTSEGYTFTFTIGGTLVRVSRAHPYPVITSAAWNDNFLVVRQLPVGLSGHDELVYSIENGKTFELLQKNDKIDIAPKARLVSVFFSEQGDVFSYDSCGTLSVLIAWRVMFQASWVPAFDSRAPSEAALLALDIELEDEDGGDDNKPKENKYWPLGVTDEDKFLAIRLSENLKEPGLPLPMFEEFELSGPAVINPTHEQKFLMESINYELLKDREANEVDIERCKAEMDKILLRQLHAACLEGKSEKALSIARLIHRDNSLDVASTIAVKTNNFSLAEAINEIRENHEQDI